MARNERYAVSDGRGGGRRVVDMLKTRVCGNMRRDPGGILVRRLRFFWGWSGLVFVVVIVALPGKIFWSFAFMRGAKLGHLSARYSTGERGTHILITIQGLIHIT